MRLFKFHLAGLVTCWLLGSSVGKVVADDDKDKDRDRRLVSQFVEHVDSLKQVAEAQRTAAKAAVDGKSAEAITEALVLLYPDYAAGIQSSDAVNIKRGLQLLEPLAKSSDSYLAADSSFYLARMLMNDERFEQAIPHLTRLVGELEAHSIHVGESVYFLGVAQAGTLDRESAVATFTRFLEENPDAAERLRVSAWRYIQELKAIQAGQLTDVQSHMDFSRRRMDLRDTGEQTQEKQDLIVSMLGKLIKEEEKKECNSSCKNGSKKQPKQKENAQAPKESQEPKPGKSQAGGSSSNPNGEAIQKVHDDSPASPWSRLRDRSRDPANNAIKEKLPARYRDIVEKYYEAANGSPSESENK